ncbi:MAG TPA: hypothetical protein VK644_12365 [Chitinophagaceae bacterium]|nr:hypothetical protein [Chitinophagaceae bacterium]
MHQTKIFYIIIDPIRSKKIRLKVDHYYSSAESEKFRVYGNSGRYVDLEKRLTSKQDPWKVLTVQSEVSDIKKTTFAVACMQDEIDFYLNDQVWKSQRPCNPRPELHN